MRRVPPRFSIPPDPYYEVMSGSDLNITCVAVGSPMPYVKWQKDKDDVLPEGSTPPIGKNVLELAGKDILSIFSIEAIGFKLSVILSPGCNRKV